MNYSKDNSSSKLKVCGECNNKFSTQTALTDHKKGCSDISNDLQKQLLKKIKSTERKVCLTCNRTFSSASSLSNHKKRCKIDNERIALDRVKGEYETKVNELNNTISNLELKVKQLIYNSNSSEKYRCTYCNRSDFSSSSSLSRHKRICSESNKKDEKIKELSQTVDMLLDLQNEWKKDKEFLNKDKEYLNKDKEILNKDKNKFADMATTNNNLIKTSISAMKYFMANYKNTPALESIEDVSSIKIKYEDDTTFILELLSVYRNENLASYIGEYILNIYKKTDSSKQSLWSSDVDRLTYIISEAVVKDKTTWVTDKKGIKVGEKVIRPALTYVKPLLQNFVMECGQKIILNHTNGYELIELVEYQKLSNHIIAIIDNRSLEKDIIKYLAPLLYWNKNSLVEESKLKKIKYIDNKKENNIGPKNSKPPENVKVIKKPKKEKYIRQNKKKKNSSNISSI